MNCKHCGAKIRVPKINQDAVRSRLISLAEKNHWSYRGIAMSLNMDYGAIHRFRHGRSLSLENFKRVEGMVNREEAS